ncbi:MAG: membrane protein insertase YidC [Gammaproteobacteria bacterium]|nr:MAG: membrane protein insertase YidC [Gammaproteobacteria bacterium]
MNNNLRPMLWALFFATVAMLWFKWDAANTAATQMTTQTTASSVTKTQSVVENQLSADLPAPTPEQGGGSAAAVPSVMAVPGSTPKMLNSGKLIHVKTDTLDIAIDTVGGTIVESKLLKYPVSVTDNTPIKLFTSTQGKLFHLQSGVNSNRATNATHQAAFSAPQSNYEITGDSISVPLTWSQDGVTVTKTFTFHQGRYDFEIKQTVNNQSSQPWHGYAYQQLKRAELVIERGLGSFNTFAGAAYSTPEKKYNKVGFEELGTSPINVKAVTGGWEAMIEHYFMGALIPVQNSKNTFYSNKNNDGNYVIGMYGDTTSVQPGSQVTFKMTGFVGPKVKDDLARIAPNLDKATDYGWLFFISEFLFNVLNWVHSVVKNWGWSIVIVTLVIKTILFPLAAKSFKSMAKMRKFQPEMERLRENYAEDRQLLGKKMMELYKKEGINPASGCLPILVQIPIFLAFYYMLMESVELRQAPWIFWIKDLSLRDPMYILPVINMALMFVQQRLNPPPSDPIQRRVMMFLPLVFGFLFLVFPSGLVLYWAVSNLFSIIQQYVITKRYGGLAHPLSHAEDKHYHPKK